MITVYTTPTCRYCPLVKRYLDGKGIEYQTVDIEADREAAQMLWDKGYRSVPVTSDGVTFVTGPNYGAIAELIKGGE